MSRFKLLVIGLTLVSLSACSNTNTAGNASATATSTALTTTTATSTATDGPCATLERNACVRKKGCVLDQPAAGVYECRDAKNKCESAVRHIDTIGPILGATDVTLIDVHRGNRDCAAAGCVVTSGKCSCPCSVLGDCDCACGGNYLARCVLPEDEAKLTGTPPQSGK